MAVGATHVEIETLKTEGLEFLGKSGEVERIFTPNLGNDRRVGGGDLKSLEGIVATSVGGVTADIGEFGEKDVGLAGLGDNLAKNNIGDAFHGGKNEEGAREGLPEIGDGSVCRGWGGWVARRNWVVKGGVGVCFVCGAGV